MSRKKVSAEQLPLFESGDALFSDDKVYRYMLTRWWDQRKSWATFILLNPSTADASTDDPTTTRCVNFARSWGCGGACIVNLFAFVSTDPRGLKSAADPVGPDNDAAIIEATVLAEQRLVAGRAPLVVAGWGSHAGRVGKLVLERSRFVRHELLKRLDLRILSINEDGSPKHPLFGDAKLRPLIWSEPMFPEAVAAAAEKKRAAEGA